MNSSDLRFYFSIFLRRLPMVVIIWVVVSVAAVSVAYLLPPVFRASAIILVQSQQIPGNLAQSTVSVSSQEQIQIIQQRLMTRDNLLEIADQYNIFADLPELSRADMVLEMRKSTGFQNLQLARFGAGRQGAGVTAFQISFISDSARQSAQVANEFVTRILERNVKLRTNRATDTLQFFVQESERLAKAITKLEAEILEFQNANAGALPSSLAFRRNQVVLLQDRLLRLESSEITLRQTIALAKQILQNPATSTGGQPRTQNQRDLEGLKAALIQQSATFSQTHPSIISLKRRVEALEVVVRQEVIDAANNPQTTVLTGNTTLIDMEAQLDLVLNQQASAKADIEKLLVSIADTPKNEIALNVFNRDYANLKTQFDAMQSSRASAATGERIELRQKGERFEVIEQATPPEKPESPNRVLIALGGSVVGLGLGFGLVLLLELLNRSVRRPSELVAKLNIQPLATIPYLVTRSERSRRRLAFLTVLLLVGVSVPSLMYAVHYYVLPIDLILEKAIVKFGLEELVARMSG